jgi:hypothetical protein
MSAQENFNVEQTVKEDCERLVFGVDIGTTQCELPGSIAD